MTDSVEDSLNDLALRATAGDRAALNAVCRRMQGPVYRLAARMLGPGADAEDATQEISIQVITRLSTFEGRSALMTWVFTIAARHLLRFRTRAGHKETATSPEVLSARLDLAMAHQAAALGATDAPTLERELQLECTQGMLLVLSRAERLAFILTDVLGASDRVGAEICEITPAAFRQRLARARAEMRPLLSERCGLADRTNPCRCEDQARSAFSAGLLRPDRLTLAKAATERDPALARADEQLGALRRLGHVFDGLDPAAAPRELWDRLVRACPDLLDA